LVVRLTLSIFPVYPFAIVFLLPGGSPPELPIRRIYSVSENPSKRAVLGESDTMLLLLFLNFRLRFYYRLEQKRGDLGQGKCMEVWKAVNRAVEQPSIRRYDLTSNSTERRCGTLRPAAFSQQLLQDPFLQVVSQGLLARR
jgi:hypothetical protein